MSKAEKMREMQLEINRLQLALEEKEKQLQAYRKRDRPMAQDFVNEKEEWGVMTNGLLVSPYGSTKLLFKKGVAETLAEICNGTLVQVDVKKQSVKNFEVVKRGH